MLGVSQRIPRGFVMKHALLAALFVLPCLTLPVLAGDGPPPKAGHVKMTWQQHFAQANSTHDGHLTAEQAKTGYAALSKHFAEIDTGNKGFVTVDEVTTWHKEQRALHHPATPNPLKPHHALHHPTGGHPAVKVSTDQIVPNTTNSVGPDAPLPGRTPG